MGAYKHKDYYELHTNNSNEINWLIKEVLKEPSTFHEYVEVSPLQNKVIFYKEGLINNNYSRWLKLKAKFFQYRYNFAQWIDIGNGFGRCSNCGHEGDTYEIWYQCTAHFCPNCGKEMENL